MLHSIGDDLMLRDRGNSHGCAIEHARRERTGDAVPSERAVSLVHCYVDQLRLFKLMESP